MCLLLYAFALFILSGGVALAAHRIPRLMRTLYAVCDLAALGVSLWALGRLARALGHSAPLSWHCTWLGALPLDFSADGLSLFFLAALLLLSPLLAIYGGQYLGHSRDNWKNAVNLCLFNFLIVSMALVALAAGAVAFALAWECMSVFSFLLILHEYDKKETRTAALLYFLFTQAGAFCVFAAFGLAFAACGSLAFADFAAMSLPMKIAAFLVALVGFGSKAGVFPLHIWLPHAHPAAPSHVSALMSGLMIKMGVYGIIRLFFALDFASPLCAWIVLGVGIVSGVFGVAMALGKHELKRLLAYSSIENIGIILMGFGLGMIGFCRGDQVMAALGFAGGLLHVLNHALFKSLLFMSAGAVIQATGLRHLDQLGGLMKNMPVTGRSFLVASAAIAGLPLLNGFISEFLIYYAAFLGARLAGIDALFSVAAILALAFIGGLAAACFSKMAGIVFLGEARQPLKTPLADKGDAGLAMRLVMALFALACFMIGLWPEPFIRLALGAVSGFLPQAAGAAVAIAPKLGFASRAFFVIILAFALIRSLCYRGKTVRNGPTWGCGYTAATARIQYTGTSYARDIVGFFHPLLKESRDYSSIGEGNIFPVWTVRHASRVDDPVEVLLRRVAAPAVFKSAAWLRWIQQGRIQLYIAYIVAAIAALLLVL